MKENRPQSCLQEPPAFPLVSVVIPARNEGPHIALTVAALLRQRREGADMEVIVVNDGSWDDTAARAESAGAAVLPWQQHRDHGNPGAARNAGASAASGDPIIFLDADCVVTAGWLEAILDAHAAGATVVGGALSMPADLPLLARCDFYCGSYLVHSRRPQHCVPHHPPTNLSVRRDAFFRTSGFSEAPPLSHTNEERAWQAELQREGYCIYFLPQAVALHYNRPGFWNLLRRNYRWGYTAIESKSQTGATRVAWLYKHPKLVIAMSLPLALAHALYILSCWTRVGTFEPLFMSPLILSSTVAYAIGMAMGGIRWLRYCGTVGARQESPPKW